MTISKLLASAPLHLKLLGGFAIVLTIAAAESSFAYLTAQENVASDESVAHSQHVLQLAGEAQSALLEMQADYRGFMLTGDEAFLHLFAVGAQTYTLGLTSLEKLTADSPAQLDKWRELKQDLTNWQYAVVEPGITARRSVDARAGASADDLLSAVQRGLSPDRISAMRRIIGDAIAVEQGLLNQQLRASAESNDRLMEVLVGGTLVVLGVGMLVAILFARNLAGALRQVEAGATKLRASEHQYRQMFENNEAIKLLIDPATRTVVEANAAACVFYGYAPRELLGRQLSDINARPPDELTELLDEAVEHESSHFETQHRLASGEIRDVEVYSSPLHDLSNAHEHGLLYSIVHDITESKKATEALRRSAAQLAEAQQIAHIGSWELDLTSQQLAWSAEHYRIAGLEPSAENLAYLHGLNYIHADDRAAVRTVFESAIAERTSYSLELRIVRPDRSVRWIHSRGAFVADTKGGAGRMVGTAQDITERKQADDERERFQRSEKLRALGQMASGVAHDLNQSLMLVASYSDLARQALVHDPPNLADLEDLMTTTTQAALDGGETVKRLLLFTRAAPEGESHRVDLSRVVNDAAQLTAPRWRDATQAEGRPISLHVEAEGHPNILGSPARIRELMTNLIFNAVDAMPAGGTIRLLVMARDGRGIVEVVDTGEGMSAEVQARVFEPFFTTKGESGTGLGLAMVFGIVEQHGGHIEVQSEPGIGTTFRMTFPVLEEAPMEVDQFPGSDIPVQSARPLRVLTVDDEPMMTKAVVRMLRPSGHLVTAAGSGEEALERLAEQSFDVVVSDMGMGAGMNGWELADMVKRRWPGVRFLLATGWGAALDLAEARTRGVDGILAKPYHPAELLHALSDRDAAA
jgi:PAS domain S-box-containing protein